MLAWPTRSLAGPTLQISVDRCKSRCAVLWTLFWGTPIAPSALGPYLQAALPPSRSSHPVLRRPIIAPINTQISSDVCPFHPVHIFSSQPGQLLVPQLHLATASSSPFPTRNTAHSTKQHSDDMPLLETITYLAGLVAITAGTVGAATVSFVWLDPSLGHPVPGAPASDRDWSPLK